MADSITEKTGEMKYFYSYCLNGCLGFVKTSLETGKRKHRNMQQRWLIEWL